MKVEQNDVNDSILTCHRNSLTKENNGVIDLSLPANVDSPSPREPINADSLEDDYAREDEDGRSFENAKNQLVVYDPAAVGAGTIEPVPDTDGYYIQPRKPRVLPSVGDFAVQCANCFKWRLIPTKEKYEEIRERILEDPFYCEKARQWRANVTCDDEPDISQDGSRLWAIDKPSIALPPPKWERLLRIRSEGSSKFADVYYKAPTGKLLRSLNEIRTYLSDHPELSDVDLKRFSFQTPRPLQEDYVRKRTRPPSSEDSRYPMLQGSVDTSNTRPLAWASSVENSDLDYNVSGSSTPSIIMPVLNSANSQPRKRSKKASSKQTSNGDHLVIS